MLVSIMKRNFTILYDSSARETPIKKKTKASIISSRSVDGKMQNAKKKKKASLHDREYRSRLLKRGNTVVARIEPRLPTEIILLTAGKRIPLIIIFTRRGVARRGSVN